MRDRRIYGVDFSGAEDAGRRVWVAEGTAQGEGRLLVTRCRRGEELPGSGRERERCLAALARLLAGGGFRAAGLDFPLGVPAAVMGGEGWEAFVLGLADRWPSPEAFRAHCQARAGGRELRRAADREARAPFSPYNLRLYRQTYYGITCVLAPLVRAGAACVLPMQPADPARPWLLEVCPAATLKRLGLYRPYKGPSPARAEARGQILAELERREGLAIADPATRLAIVADAGGDALDSVVAALAAFRALRAPGGPARAGNPAYAQEGCIYV